MKTIEEVREKRNAYMRRYYANLSAEKKVEWNRRCSEWRKAHPQQRVSSVRKHLLKQHGLTPEQYDALLNKQNGVCAICYKPQTASTGGRYGSSPLLAVDHDHSTGEVRGLLCNHCNSMLGMARDNIDLLCRAVEYLTPNVTEMFT